MYELSLIGPAYFLALDRETQKAAFAHRCHLAFGRVDLELEDRFQMPRDGVHHPLGGALVFDKNDHVIGVARKAVSPPLQLKVELVQQDKDANFPCTNAAFTLSIEPVGFAVMCQLASTL